MHKTASSPQKVFTRKFPKHSLYAISLAVLLCPFGLRAERLVTDTVRYWNLAYYSPATVADLAADTEHWTYNDKGRYFNAVETDGQLLRANGNIIKETDGLYIGAGISSGSLLLRHAMGSDNGLQMQRNQAITIKSLKAGQTVSVTLKSSSKDAVGIASVSNLDGEYGQSTYQTSTFTKFDFAVIADGSVSFTNSGGIVYQSVLVTEERVDTSQAAATPQISQQDGLVTITCATPGASIVYSIINHGTVDDYALSYREPFRINRSCRVRAVASAPGLSRSEVADTTLEIPLELPFAGKPFVLDPEPLDRGAVAVYTGSLSKYLVSWRWLATDPRDITFNVYRNGEKLNTTPIWKSTCQMDISGSADAVYTVEAIHDGQVIETSQALTIPKIYLDVPVHRPADSSTQSGEFTYCPGDCMVADLDGDQQYEIVMKWDPSNKEGQNDDANTAGQKDNSLSGYTGHVIIDAYKMDGTQLWRINLGRNIRAGAHYTQLMVYDLDGDGKAEVACKTAPGTMDGKGNWVLLGSDRPDVDYRTTVGGKSGVIISGSEYLTVFSGETGENLATIPYQPTHNAVSWGDSYGNRANRYLAAVAYLDGAHPSLVMCRGYYTAAFLWAVDFSRDEEGKGCLETRWLHQSTRAGYGAYGEGAHSISVADVDGDLCDEIIYGSCGIDHDGTLMYRTGLGHGDALHVGDFDPDRPGLEVMMVHEETSAKYGIEMHDALTGKHLSGVFAGTDVGRGLCADIDNSHRGCEYWGYSYNVYAADGTLICSDKRPSVNFRTYWDSDLLEECTETGTITKWDSGKNTQVITMSGKGAGTDLIKYTPCLQADIFGDWREEQIYYDNATRSHLWIYTTTIPTDYRVETLMHDHHYRMATVWQTSAYNQPPHLSYYLPDYAKQVRTALEPVYAGQGQVVARRYYNLQGQPIAQPAEGLYLEETLYSDGSRRCEKLFAE